MPAHYQDSPFGIAVHAHVNKADAKFKPDAPEFKVDLSLTGKAAQDFKEKVIFQSDEAFKNFKESDKYLAMKPKDQREMVVYYPFEEVEDDEGNKTGEVIFDFRQNEKLKLKDGTFKTVVLGIYDAKGKEMDKLVRSGSELRVKYSFRAIPMPSLHKAGIRMDFMGVQVKTLSEGKGASTQFSEVDGYEDDGKGYTPAPPSDADAGADY